MGGGVVLEGVILRGVSNDLVPYLVIYIQFSDQFELH